MVLNNRNELKVLKGTPWCNMCASYCHLPLVLVLQSKIVSLNQVEMGTNQVKQHFAW